MNRRVRSVSKSNQDSNKNKNSIKKETQKNIQNKNNNLKRPGLLNPHPIPLQKKPFQENDPKNNYNKLSKNKSQVEKKIQMSNNMNGEIQKNGSFSIDNTYVTPLSSFESHLNNNPKFHHDFFNQNSSIIKRMPNYQEHSNKRSFYDNFRKNSLSFRKNNMELQTAIKKGENDTIIITCCIKDMITSFKDMIQIKLFEIFCFISSPIVKNKFGYLEFVFKDDSAAINCIFYNNDEINISLNRKQKYRCLGHLKQNDRKNTTINIRKNDRPTRRQNDADEEEEDVYMMAVHIRACTEEEKNYEQELIECSLQQLRQIY